VTQEDNIKEKIEKLENQIDDRNDKSVKRKILSLPRSVLGYVKKSNGFLTSEGKYLSKPEWHAVALGISFPALAYMLPTPLGESMIIAMLLMLRTGFKKLGDGLEGHMADVMHELTYMMASATLTVALFKYKLGGRLEEIDLSNLAVKMLVGA